LRVGHSQERARVDADEFDEESRDARQNQVGCKNFARQSARTNEIRAISDRLAIAHNTVISRAQPPEPPRDGAGSDEFVDRCGVNALDRGDESIGKTHAPGEPGWGSIIAVAGKEAADAADAISEGGGRSACIKNCEERHGMTDGGIVSGDAPGHECEGGESGEQASEPGESVGAKEQM